MPIRINGQEWRDIINGSSFDEDIYGNGGDDTLFGNGGNDMLIGGAGADYMSGGTGFDIVSYQTSTAGVWATIGGYGSSGDAQGDYIETDVEILFGSNYGDILIGNDAGNSLWGGGGSDYLVGLGGMDYLFGEDGADHLTGGEGADLLSGGTGFDTAYFDDSATGVMVTVGGKGFYGTAEGDTISSDIESIVGSRYDDTLIGDGNGNTLYGGKGRDSLVGYGGNDTLVGGAGADFLYGGEGDDEVSYADSAAGVWVDLRGGYAGGGDAEGDWVSGDIEDFRGSDHRDVVFGSGVANDVTLRDGDDVTYLGGGHDVAWGGDGQDFLSGEEGDDQLYGDAGADTLFGGEGRDYLTGGDGNDTMTGGLGADSFRFSSFDLGDTDTIKDFHRSEGDKIRLNAVDADANMAGNQAFSFIGTSAFTGSAGQLRYVNNGVETLVYGDVNGDKAADFTIRLTDAPGLIATDFQL
jgi:Ca2+-binding RTX toxin-like protein